MINWLKSIAGSGSFVRFCMMGGFNAALSLGLTAFLHEVLHAAEELAYAITLITIFSVNFFTSRHFVFQASDGSSRTQLTRFLASSLSFRLFEYLAFLLVHTVLGVYYLIAVVIVQGTSFVAKYFFYRAFVFIGKQGGGGET